MWALVVAVAAAGPLEVPYSGRVFDGSGAPRNGTAEIAVSLYADATTPTALWSEVWSVVLVDGYFTVILGQKVSFPESAFSGGEGWLEVAVDGQPLGDRTPVLPVATARVVERLPVVDGEPYPCTAARIGRWIFDASVGWAKVCAVPGAWTRW